MNGTSRHVFSPARVAEEILLTGLCLSAALLVEGLWAALADDEVSLTLADGTLVICEEGTMFKGFFSLVDIAVPFFFSICSDVLDELGEGHQRVVLSI